MSTPAVTLETYAQILARLACRRDGTVAQVLAELGVTPEDLARDEPALRAQLREAWPRRKGVAAMKFAAALGDELEKLSLLGAAPGELPGAPPVVQVPLALQAPTATDGPSRWVAQAPSYVAAGPAVGAPHGGGVVQGPPAHVAEPPPPAPPPLRAPSGLGTTAVFSPGTAVTPAMPFAAPGAPAEAVSALAATEARGAVATPGSGTVAVGREVAPPPLPAGVADLTLRQYASLRVDLQLGPERAAAILERYRVSADGREALDAYWRVRFEVDPLLRMEFTRAYAEYVTWLKAQPGG